MMNNTRITILADTIVDDNKIATYGAVLNVDADTVSFSTRNNDSEACKNHRDVIRKDRADFEDLAYKIQDMLKI